MKTKRIKLKKRALSDAQKKELEEALQLAEKEDEDKKDIQRQAEIESKAEKEQLQQDEKEDEGEKKTQDAENAQEDSSDAEDMDFEPTKEPSALEARELIKKQLDAIEANINEHKEQEAEKKNAEDEGKKEQEFLTPQQAAEIIRQFKKLLPPQSKGGTLSVSPDIKAKSIDEAGKILKKMLATKNK